MGIVTTGDDGGFFEIKKLGRASPGFLDPGTHLRSWGTLTASFGEELLLCGWSLSFGSLRSR
jgi:hypothetical protein